jgi:hypothetical protein
MQEESQNAETGEKPVVGEGGKGFRMPLTFFSEDIDENKSSQSGYNAEKFEIEKSNKFEEFSNEEKGKEDEGKRVLKTTNLQNRLIMMSIPFLLLHKYHLKSLI